MHGRGDSSKKKLLLVEDDAIIALAQAKAIESFGYTAITAGSGDAAIKLALGSEEICLVLMDIDLGAGIDGTEAARKILAARNMPIVFLTSHSEREMVEKVRGITRYGYVIKNSGDFVLQSSIEIALELFDAHERTKGQETEQVRLNRALRMLSDSNQALIRAVDESALLDKVCAIIVEVGGYRMAWVGFAEQDEARTLRPVAHAGHDEGYLESAGISWADDERGRGPCNAAIRAGKPSVVHDTAGDPPFAPWRDAAVRNGYRSIIVVPLIGEGRAFGAIGIYSAEADVFDAEEIEILQELAGDLSYGIVSLRTRAAHERAMADLLLFRRLLDQSSDAIFVVDSRTRRVLDANDSACRLLEYTREELLDLRITDVDLALSDQSFWAESLKAVRAAGSLVREGRRRRRNGAEFPVEISVSGAAQGQAEYLIAVVRDISDRKRAEDESKAHLWFYESMDRVTQTVQGTDDLEEAANNVLDAVLSIFGCDRAFLNYPCDPEVASWRAPMERTRPEYPGALAQGIEIPMDRETREAYKAILAAKGPVTFGPEADQPLAGDIPLRFKERSLIMMALRPKTEMPWVFGLHQCSHARVWTPEERRLFEEIGTRLALVLSSLSTRRDLLEREAIYRSLFEDSANAIAEEDFSAMQSYIADLRQEGVSDLGSYFTERPDELIRCAGLIRLVRVNTEYRGMVGAKGADEISPTLAPYLNRNKEALEGFRDEILSLAEGRLPFDREFPNATRSSDIKWVKLRMSIVPGYEKDWSRVLASFMDITELKRIEGKLEKAAGEKEFLMRELEHRVKNSLHLISSLLSLDSQRSVDQETKQVLVDAQMRVQSIALIYDFLSHSSSLDRLDSATYAEDLVRLLYETYAGARGDIRVRRVLDSFELSIKNCVPMGLIINELLNNAFKYAFPSGRVGEITVELRKTESATILRVLDDGVGLPPGFDWRTSKSLGLQLVNMLAAQLGGTMALSSGAGVAVTIEIPGPS